MSQHRFALSNLVRGKSLASALAVTVAGATLALVASPAHAAVDADDTTFTPVATDLIGVGSDTSQHALLLAANAYNATSPAHKLATFAATGGGTITLPGGAINRPNGSGAGKALLYNPSNPDVDFARSSSALSPAEVSAGLQAFPFALDTLKMAVSNSVPSHAPASLTIAQILSIYKGEVTNWSEVGGTAGVIKPKIPQAGSGTRSFFENQLKAANGGAAVTLAASVAEVQEHDDTSIKNDPDAIAPFSQGRAGLLGTTLRLENGFSADRALYNVVRSADLGNADVQAVFGESGFLCADSSRTVIEQAGFKQLARGDEDGVCGQATQSTTSDFTTNDAPAPVATTTSVNATSTSPRTVKVVATVSGNGGPTGTVTISEAGSSVDLPLSGGQATLNLTGVAPGSHSYAVTYTPEEGTAFVTSEGSDQVQVKTSSSLKENFPSSLKKGQKAKGTVSVTLQGTSTQATGKVVVKDGRKTVGSGALKSGKASIKLDKLSAGKHKLTVVYSGDGNASGTSKKITIKQKK